MLFRSFLFYHFELASWGVTDFNNQIVYGGSSNLGDKYRYTRLCLPGKAKNASYIEDAAAIAAYGLKENTKIFDDIRPERYGEVTAAGSAYYALRTLL